MGLRKKLQVIKPFTSKNDQITPFKLVGLKKSLRINNLPNQTLI